MGFSIAKDFYYGDPNDSRQVQSGKDRIPLYRPTYTSPGNVVLVSTIGASIDELVYYYNNVLANAQLHGKPVKQCLHYFWMRPYIRYDAHAVMCPWYDRYEEARRFLSALHSIEKDGCFFYDADQSWELTMVAQDDRVHIREWDPDDAEDHVLINCARDAIERQSREILVKTTTIVDQLKSALGHDYWSMKSY